MMKRRSVTEQKKDLSTLRAFHKRLLKICPLHFSEFKVYQEPQFNAYIGFGASAYYTAQITLPETTEAERKRMGINGLPIQGFLVATSEIWPHNDEGPNMNKTVRTYTLSIEFKALGRYTLRRWEDKIYAKFYAFSTNKEDVLRQLIAWLPKFKAVEKALKDKTYSWRR